ncbi:MAG: hypothetical protein H8D37_02670 [Chloroflexi bacterium]|nr:hypothetical protein [Chloroflexota bacterium]
MRTLYLRLEFLASGEYNDVVSSAEFIGGTPSNPNKLRLWVIDGSFLDIWLSADGDYAFHWERRRQTGEIFRWDNAPHHPEIITFPQHLHYGDESKIVESRLSKEPESALRQILDFIQTQLSSQQ